MKKIDSLMGEYKKSLNEMSDNINLLEKEYKKIHEKIESESRLQKNLSLKYKTLNDYVRIQSLIPKEILGLKKQYKKLLEQSSSEDITIKQQKELHEKTRLVKQNIKEKCKHEMYFYTIDNSYDPDYMDPEYRKCLICGLEERGNHFRGEFRKINSKTAMIIDNPYDFYKHIENLGKKYDAVENHILCSGTKELEKYYFYPQQKGILKELLGLKI